jgi:molecular chaperone DnaK
MAELKTALEGSDIALIKDRTTALETAVYPITEALYRKASEASQSQQQQTDAGADADTGAQRNNDDAVDADYEEKK